MADSKNNTPLNEPKVTRGTKNAITPGEKPEKEQTPIDKVISRELTEIVKDINFEEKFESIKIAIESIEIEHLLPVLEKINSKLNPILGALYGVSNINESTNPESLLSKLGNLNPKLTMLEPIDSILNSIYSLLTEQINNEPSGSKPGDSDIAVFAKIENLLKDISTKTVPSILSAINNLVNFNDFNSRIDQMIDVIKSKNGGELNTKALQYDVNIKASGLDNNTVKSLIDLSNIKINSTSYLKNLDKIVSSLSNLKTLNDVKVNTKTIKNIAYSISILGTIDLSVLDGFNKSSVKPLFILIDALKEFLKFNGDLDSVALHTDKITDINKAIKLIIKTSLLLRFLASISPKKIDISKHVKVLNDVIKQIDSINKLNNTNNLKSVYDSVKYIAKINLLIAAVALTLPLAYLGAFAITAEVKVLNKIVVGLNKGIAKVDKNAMVNIKSLSKIVIAASAVLLLGALVGGFVLQHFADILGFTAVLSIFIFATIGAFNLATRGMKEAKINAGNFNKLLLVSAGVMILGGLIMTLYSPLILGALAFTVVLGMFIFLTIAAINLADFYGMVDSFKTAKDFAILIGVSAGTMLLGGFILKAFPWLPESIMTFTLCLAGFIFAVTFLWNLASVGMGKAIESADKFGYLIGLSTLSLLLGGFLFHKYPQLIVSTLLFGTVLALFIGLVTLAYALSSELLKKGKVDAKNLGILVGISAAALLIGGAFMLIPGMPVAVLKFAALFVAFLGAVVFIYSIASKQIKNAKKTAKAFGLVVLFTSAALLIGGGLLLAYPGLDMACLKFVALSALFIVVFGGSIWLLGKIKKKALIQGAIAMAGIGVLILLFGFAFTSISKVMVEIDKVKKPWEAVAIIGTIIAAMVGLVIGLGFLTKIPGLKEGMAIGEALLLGIAVIIGAFGEAFSYLVKAMQELDKVKDPEESLKLMGTVVGAVGAFVAIFGLLSYIPGFAIGMAVAEGLLAGMAAIIGAFAEAFNLLIVPMKALDQVNDPVGKIEIMHSVLDKISGLVIFLGVLSSIPPLALGMAVAEGLLAGIIAIIKQIAGAMSVVADSIRDVETLEGFNPEGPKQAISNYASLFPAIEPLADLGLVFTMSIVKKNARGMSEVVMSIAESIKDICDLKTSDGRNLTSSDFSLAAQNISDIVTTVGGALIDVYKQNPEMFSSGFIGDLLGADNPFTIVTKSCSKMSKLILDISKGVKGFAELKMPLYDENGKQIGMRDMKQADFNNAAKGIASIITCVGKALIDTYNLAPEMFEWELIADNPITSVTKSCSKMGELISSISEGVKSFAELKMPIYDDNGQVKGYRDMNPQDFENAATNISDIIKCMSQALIDTYNANPNLFTDPIKWRGSGDKSPIGMVAKALDGVGALVKDGADGIKAVAEMKIDWKSLEPTDPNDPSSTKVGKIVSILAQGVLDVYEANPKIFTDDSWFHTDPQKTPFGMVMQCLEKLTPFIKSAAASVDEISKLQFSAKDLGTNGEVSTKVRGVVGVLPKTIVDLMDDKKYGEYLKNEDYVEIFDKVGKMYGHFSTVVAEASNAFNSVLAVDFKGGNLDDTAELMKNMLKKLASAIFDVAKTNTSLINTPAPDSIASAFSTFKDIITNVTTAYNTALTELNKLGVKKNNTTVIDNIANNLGAMISKLSNTIQPNSMLLDTNLISAFNTNVTTYSDAIGQFVETYGSIPGDLSNYDKLVESMGKVNTEVSKIDNVEAFDTEQQALSKYIVTLNSLNLTKVQAFTDLLEALNKLSTKLSSLDNFTTTLNTKISATLAELAKQIRNSENVINKADTLQNQRHEAIKNSIKEIQSIMDKKLIVEVNHIEISDNNPDYNPGTVNTPLAISPSLNNTMKTVASTIGGGNTGDGIDYEKLKLAIQQAIQNAGGIAFLDRNKEQS